MPKAKHKKPSKAEQIRRRKLRAKAAIDLGIDDPPAPPPRRPPPATAPPMTGKRDVSKGGRGVRVPEQMKALMGTTRLDRVAPEPPVELLALKELAPIDVLPDPPDWMDEPVAVTEWWRTGKLLVDAQGLTAGELPALAMMCYLYGAFAAIASDPFDSEGRRQVPPASMVAQLRNLLNDFGLTPAAQAKARAAANANKAPGASDPPAKPANKFAGIGQR